MSQDVFSTINPAATSGTQLATLLNNFKEALMSGLSGTVRPPELDPGGAWIDTSMELTPNFYWTYKVWTGTADIEIFRINLQTGKATISEASSAFVISRVSADAVGPYLRLQKQRVANSGQVVDSDVVGEIQFMGRTSGGADPIVGYIRATASDSMTIGAQGTMLTFLATKDGDAAVSEFMRLMDGKLGLGVTQPDTAIHVRSTTGIKSEIYEDNAVGAKVILHKRRATGDGVLVDDEVGSLDFSASDTANTQTATARILATAIEGHTASAKGTVLEIHATDLGDTAPTMKMEIGENIESIVPHTLNALKLVEQNVATAASIVALSSAKAVVNFTGATATSLKGIDATGLSKVVTLHNNSTGVITIENENAGASATNRFKLPDSAPIVLTSGNSVEMFYSVADSRWKIKSSAGGSGGYSVSAVESISAAGSVGISLTTKRQLRHIQGNAASVTTANAPFGAAAPQDGTEITLVGNSDTNSVIIPYSDTAKGAVGNFTEIELGLYRVVSFVYSASLDRYLLVQGAM